MLILIKSFGYNKKGVDYFGRKNYSEALKWYNKAIELNPNCSDAYYNKGSALFELAKYAEAYVCFSKTIELDQNNLDLKAYFNKSHVQHEMLLKRDYKIMLKKSRYHYVYGLIKKFTIRFCIFAFINFLFFCFFFIII